MNNALFDAFIAHLFGSANDRDYFGKLQKVKYVPVSRSWKYRDAIKKVLWLTAMSRNAITLLMACLLTQYFEKTFGTVPYELSGTNGW